MSLRSIKAFNKQEVQIQTQNVSFYLNKLVAFGHQYIDYRAINPPILNHMQSE